MMKHMVSLVKQENSYLHYPEKIHKKRIDHITF
jgi:uncharacterized membrane protein